MMQRFFSVRHDSFEGRGKPWVGRIVRGLEQLPLCEECGAEAPALRATCRDCST